MSLARIALFATLVLGSALLAQQPSLPRAPAKPTSKQIAHWVEQLGDDDFHLREAATEKLAKAGNTAESALRKAIDSPDAEVVHRAKDLLERIQLARDPSRGAAAFQILDYDKAVEKARSEKKLVMIDCYADWCGPCKQMNLQTYSAEPVQKFLKEKTIAIRINIDDNAQLVARYKVEAIPSVVFIDGAGKEVGRVVGFQQPEKFLELAGKFVK